MVSGKRIPLHKHTNGRLRYVEGDIACIAVGYPTYVMPAQHMPLGMAPMLCIGYSATVLRPLYFYAQHSAGDSFYSKPGIYPAGEF